MIDIHTHILMDVDDGSKSLEQSLEMIKMEIKSGVSNILLTPHFVVNDFIDERVKKIYKQFDILKEQVKDLSVSLFLGAELMYSNLLLAKLKDKKVITLNNSNCILLEFPLLDRGYAIINILSEIQHFGYKIILAHPERYTYLSLDDLDAIHRMGVKIQVNTSSILKLFGKEVYKRVNYLLESNLVDFIASDCHDLKYRKPNLDKVAKQMKKYNIKNNFFEWIDE